MKYEYNLHLFKCESVTMVLMPLGEKSGPHRETLGSNVQEKLLVQASLSKRTIKWMYQVDKDEYISSRVKFKCYLLSFSQNVLNFSHLNGDRTQFDTIFVSPLMLLERQPFFDYIISFPQHGRLKSDTPKD